MNNIKFAQDISACMADPEHIKKYPDQKQRAAMCYNMAKAEQDTGAIADPAPVEAKSRIEVLNDIRKLAEKNGIIIPDEKLLSLFQMSTNASLLSFKFNVSLSGDTHEIKVFPRKKLWVEGYNKYFDFNEKFFDDVISNFENEKLFKPFGDEQHKLGVKFFDIVELYKKPDGLYAQIKLNELGKNSIKDRNYSYISPEWGDRTDTDGVKHKNVLWAVTLTNIPAMEGEIPMLQDQIKLQKTTLEKGVKDGFNSKTYSFKNKKYFQAR